MDPITVTAITSVVSYLAGKAFDKAFDTSTEEFTKGSINWLRSILFKDGKPKEELKELQDDPSNKLNHESVILNLKKAIQKDPNTEKFLLDISQVIESRKNNGEHTTSIKNSKNINTGSISAGGNVILGDNNS